MTHSEQIGPQCAGRTRERCDRSARLAARESESGETEGDLVRVCRVRGRLRSNSNAKRIATLNTWCRGGAEPGPAPFARRDQWMNVTMRSLNLVVMNMMRCSGAPYWFYHHAMVYAVAAGGV